MELTKGIDIDDNYYMFETLDELVEMLKDDEYEVSLNIRKRGKMRRFEVKL